MKEIYVTPGIKLDQFLKYIDEVATGGEAKVLIQSGAVEVNQQIEIKRGYKIKEGDVIKVKGKEYKVFFK